MSRVSVLPHAAQKAPDQVFRLRQDSASHEARTRPKGRTLFVHQHVIWPEDNHHTFYNTNCINSDYGETLVTGDILFKYPAYGNHLISWVCRKKHQYHFFLNTTRTTTSFLDIAFGRHFVYVTFRCHFWTSLLNVTFGHHFWTSLLDVTFERHFWMALLDVTFGRHFLMHILFFTFGCCFGRCSDNFWK